MEVRSLKSLSRKALGGGPSTFWALRLLKSLSPEILGGGPGTNGGNRGIAWYTTCITPSTLVYLLVISSIQHGITWYTLV